MSDLLQWLMDVYTKAKSNDFEWKPVYPNNMISNGKCGIFTDMSFKSGNKFEYLKFTVQYMSRCDENGMSHPEEGIKYYVLHSLRLQDLDYEIRVPEPGKIADRADHINEYGRFRHVFDDEETAKKVVCSELVHMIYPYTYILDDEEGEKWNEFLYSFRED